MKRQVGGIPMGLGKVQQHLREPFTVRTGPVSPDLTKRFFQSKRLLFPVVVPGFERFDFRLLKPAPVTAFLFLFLLFSALHTLRLGLHDIPLLVRQQIVFLTNPLPPTQFTSWFQAKLTVHNIGPNENQERLSCIEIKQLDVFNREHCVSWHSLLCTEKQCGLFY